ncbi:MAG TPA: GNVR domain-containing protein, partial [Longimicrobiales bacterium]|nr:GNVR domain-containing protein [Longimicrobiales bacterium]
MSNRITNAQGFAPVEAHTNGAGASRREVSHLRELYNFVLRNRLLVLLVPVVVVLATLGFVLAATPVYDAASWIRVDEEQSNLPVLDALQTISSGDIIHTEMAELLRRPVAEEVVDSLALQVLVTEPDRVPRRDLLADIRVDRAAPAGDYRLERDGSEFMLLDGEDAMGRVAVGDRVEVAGASFLLGPGALEEDEVSFSVLDFEEALAEFRKTLEVRRPDRDADLLRIRYQSSDTVLVHEVPNAMAATFIRRRQEVRKTEARSTVDFLNQQLAGLAGQLRAAEQDLEQFREAENIVNLEKEGEFNVARYSELRAERDRLQAERQALAEMLDAAEARAAVVDDPLAPSPFRDLIAFPTLFSNFSVSELFRSMAEVENQRAELLNRREPEDPDVQVLTGRIRALESQLRNIAETYHEGLGQQVAGFNEQLAQYQQELRTVPEREIQFARLFRNAEVLEEIYLMLQTRLKEAEIAAAVEDPSVRVVEPAVAPVDPIRPNKPLSLVLALLLGLSLGAGAAFLRENMDTTVHTREDLQEVAPGVAVLGLIPRIKEATVNGDHVRVPSAGAGRDLSHRLVTGRDPRSPISEAYRS